MDNLVMIVLQSKLTKKIVFNEREVRDKEKLNNTQITRLSAVHLLLVNVKEYLHAIKNNSDVNNIRININSF